MDSVFCPVSYLCMDKKIKQVKLNVCDRACYVACYANPL